MVTKKMYEKINWTNDNYDRVIGEEIVEYDMKSAGLNVTKDFKLLPVNFINRLERLYGKKDINIQLGKEQKVNKEYSKRFKESMAEVRRWFLENNDLNEDDVISIKNDAIFVIGRCASRQFSENVKFVEKNVYSSFIRMNKLELYYNKHGIDVKGINDDVLEHHKDYILSFLMNMLNRMENLSKPDQIRYLINFTDRYIRKELPVGYYRNFSDTSAFAVEIQGIGIRHLMDYSTMDNVNISYNYNNVIIPMTKIISK